MRVRGVIELSNADVLNLLSVLGEIPGGNELAYKLYSELFDRALEAGIDPYAKPKKARPCK